MTGELGLPRLLKHSEFDNFSDWVDACYWQFRAMVHDPGMTILGKRLSVAGRVAGDGREAAFWHLMTDSRIGHEIRTLSLHRGALIGRVWRLLELLSEGDMRAVWWREPGGKRPTVTVAPVNFDFLVILRETPCQLVLTTAYPVKHRNKGKHMATAASAWESGACAAGVVRRGRLTGPSRSEAVVERYRAYMS